MEIQLEEQFKTVAGTSTNSKKNSSEKPSASAQAARAAAFTERRRKRPGGRTGSLPSITSHVVVPERRTLFAGRDDGYLIVWRSPSERGVDMKETAYDGHTGGITCVHWAPTLGNEGMLFTGSQDSTIRAWSFGRRDTSDACKQVLRGHGGTIMDLDYSGKYLVSVSNDRTMRIWRPTPGRQILLYPWFEMLQVIKSPDGPETCFTSVGIRAAESTHIYAGDSGGNLHMIDQSGSSSSSSSNSNSSSSASTSSPSTLNHDEVMPFEINKRWRRDQAPPHSLGITHIKIVPSQNFIITLSYDCTLRVYDAMSAKPFLTEENPHRCRFTGLDWNDTHQELVLIDSGGWVYIWNIYMEKCVKEQQLRCVPLPPGKRALDHAALVSISIRPVHQTFIVSGGNTIEQWHISRELSFKEHKGHSGPIVAIMSIPTAANGGGSHMYDAMESGGSKSKGDDDDEKNVVAAMTRGDAEHGDAEHGDAVLYSASLDNTIRSWDPYDMACVSTMEETSSEISCMTHIPLAGLLVTGSDDGAVRFWNPASGSTIMLRGHENTVSCMCMCHLQRNHFLITGGYDGKVGFWDVTKRTRSVKPRIENIFQAHKGHEMKFGGPNSQGHTVDAEILCIAYHEVDPDEQNRVFLTGGNDSIVRIWNVMSYQLESELEGHDDSITCMSLDANFLFTGSDDKTIRIWNLVHVKEAYQLSVIKCAHASPVQDIMILEDTGHLVSCAFDGKIRLWDWGHEEEMNSKQQEISSEDDIEDHGEHHVLHEFSHPSQFRCLGYYTNLKQILVGTEESNILTFTLPNGSKDTTAETKISEQKSYESKYDADKNQDTQDAETDDGGGRSPRPGQLSTE
jgi:WD40 repeat protein